MQPIDPVKIERLALTLEQFFVHIKMPNTQAALDMEERLVREMKRDYHQKPSLVYGDEVIRYYLGKKLVKTFPVPSKQTFYCYCDTSKVSLIDKHEFIGKNALHLVPGLGVLAAGQEAEAASQSGARRLKKVENNNNNNNNNG